MSNQHPKPDLRLAVDVGGTFTDIALLENGAIRGVDKVPTTPADPSLGVEDAVRRIVATCDPAAISALVHATTLVSNTLIERKGAKTAFVTTKGFRDILFIGREQRYDLYDLFLDLPQPLVARHLSFELDERILSDGSVQRPLDETQIHGLAAELRSHKVEALGVALLHSYLNPDHERQVERILTELLPDLRITISSEVSPELGEFKRMSTTVANAYVLPLVDEYLKILDRRMADQGLKCPIHIMLSTGGLTTVDRARLFPVRLVESGPSAGVLAANRWAQLAGQANIVAFDMGGTTAKSGLVENGVPLLAREHEVARVYRFAKGSGLPLRVPVLDLIEIGAGGGSIARIGSMGLPIVGPDSSGAEPGPVCYGRGGREPTVTDADLILGYLNPDYFLGGDMKLDIGSARGALDKFGNALGIDGPGAAAAIHQVVNENMAAATRMHAIERGRDLRRYTLVATGGAGPVHAWGVARNLGIETIVFPPSAGVASALGMLAAPSSFDFVRSIPSSLDGVDWALVTASLEAMMTEGHDALSSAGIDASRHSVTVMADVRYAGQGETMAINFGDDPGPREFEWMMERFEEAYVNVYGQKPPGIGAEVAAWRVHVAGPDREFRPLPPKGRQGARKGKRTALFPQFGGLLEVDVWDRYSLGSGARVIGPAMVEERESTVVLGPDSVGEVDPHGSLIAKVS